MENLNVLQEELLAKLEMLEQGVMNDKTLAEIRMINRRLYEIRVASTCKMVKTDELDIYQEVVSDTEDVFWMSFSNQGLPFIGYVKVYYNDTRHGNIVYEVKYEYQNNGYALKTLNAIWPIILERGLEKPIFRVVKSNIASIKTILNFGGVPMPFDSEDEICYLVDLKEKKALKRGL